MRSITRYILLLFCIAGWQSNLSAQTVMRTLGANRLVGEIKLDGVLDEAAWASAQKATGFTQFGPRPGESSMQRTEVSIVYDNDAIYIGAMMYDNEPNKIYKQLSGRDDDGGNTDLFGVTFDTYNDHQNATQFAVTAAGVQVDAIYKFGGRNTAWNAAWYSEVQITDKGWSVEMKIPYSALRFPKKAEQLWNVNFARGIRRYREFSYWNTLLPTDANALDRAGQLTGISNIEAPVRLALLPYISAYTQNYDGTSTNSLNGGLDIKYGLNESFTLDMTLVPDFGQTIYDKQVLNLSPIEARYNENRYFFTEGLDLFNKNDLFYSRRVGGSPVNAGSLNGSLQPGEIVTASPLTTRLYNATKLSGRTKSKLGVGFFNAVSESANASVLDTVTGHTRRVQTAPLTNYNVVVLDQALKNNSYISLINTNVYREENSYNADVTALLFKLANKSNSYGISGSGDVSQLYKPGNTDIGHRYHLSIGKISGNYNWNLSTNSISDHFNPNDLGYLDRNNITTYLFDHYYNIYKPVGILVQAYNHVGITYNRVFNPDVFQQANIFGSHTYMFINYAALGAYWTIQPFTSNDYLEPRTPGRYFVAPENYMAGGFYSTDYRRNFAYDIQITNRWYSTRGRNLFSWSISPRYRFSNKLSFIYSLSGDNNINEVGYAAKLRDSVIFGTRDVHTITNSLTGAYIFSGNMALKLDARHYWSQAEYQKYGLLQSDGSIDYTVPYSGNRNVNFNTFNLYLSFVWQFRPGSEMTVVYQNSIYSSPNAPVLVYDYFKDVDNTFRSPQTNSLSVKIIYYLEYQDIKRWVRRS